MVFPLAPPPIDARFRTFPRRHDMGGCCYRGIYHHHCKKKPKEQKKERQTTLLFHRISVALFGLTVDVARSAIRGLIGKNSAARHMDEVVLAV